MHEITQQLVETVISQKPTSVLDMGCGNGIIAHAVKDALPDTYVVGVDIQPQTLSVPFIQSDIFENVTGTYDVIVCTLPNQKTSECQGFDPFLCDGGEDGMELVGRFYDSVYNHLLENGIILLLIDGEIVQLA